LVALLLAAAEGDEPSFSELYRRTSAKLFGVVLRICPDRGIAEDVLVDVYLTIWRRAGAFDPAGRPITWMATIARNGRSTPCAASRVLRQSRSTWSPRWPTVPRWQKPP
jgi:DNA-directed RNA polymerase specialized sigma24 family protein